LFRIRLAQQVTNRLHSTEQSRVKLGRSDQIGVVEWCGVVQSGAVQL